MEQPINSEIGSGMQSMPAAKSKGPMIAIGVIVALVVIAGIVYAMMSKTSEPMTTATPTASMSPSVSPSASPEATTTPTTVTQSKVYSNSYMSVTIPAGWSYSTAKSGAAINITKGNYILYINSRASQASGVEGGRFVEYAGGAPSVEAVIKEWPTDPCYGSPTASSTLIVDSTSTKRTDLYVGAHDTAEYCNKPSQGTVWYFSYLGNGINYYKNPPAGDSLGWVVTMAYNSRDVSALPQKDSVELNAMLKDMSSILATLKIKEPIVYTNAQYNFSLTLPATWKGYKVFSSYGSQGVGAPTYLAFAMPTSDKTKCVVSVTDEVCGYAAPLTITVIAKDRQGNMGGTKITEDSTNAYYYSMYSDYNKLPNDLKSINFEIPKVISSFGFTN